MAWWGGPPCLLHHQINDRFTVAGAAPPDRETSEIMSRIPFIQNREELWIFAG